MKLTRSVVAFLLALALFCLPLCGCGKSQGKALLTLERDGQKTTFSASDYQFLLSRLKAGLISNGMTNGGGSAAYDAFWEMQGYFDGDKLKTWDTYYREQVLETCKIYLVGLWLFEKNGLKLSQTATENIRQEMEDILTYSGNGSKTKLNAELSKYGMNYDLLKTFYETEAKAGTVQTFLYGENAGKLDASVKDPYLSEHYFRYKRISLSEEGAEQAQALLAELQDATDEEFEAVMLEKNGSDEFTDGYYLPRGATFGETAEQIAFFTQISERLETMGIGETVLLETVEGLLILRRYEPTPGAYDLEENAMWFSSFAGNLAAELFQKECASYLSDITVDEAVLAGVPVLKEIEPNYYF